MMENVTFERQEINQIWKEWISLSTLTDQIPQQYQHGFFVAPLELTCLDAFTDNLVIGTNVGLVYVAHLPSFNLMRLKCESVNFSLTCVSCVSSVDDMIAVGCQNGTINIFQLSRALLLSEALQRSDHPELYAKWKTPKRFTVNLHNDSLTSLKWSKNGLMLFSGDCNGHVGVIDVDYENCECIGKLIYKVSSSVVQLSYSHKLLAISCEERCILYSFHEEKAIVVGRKPKNPPGRYGCTFAPSSDNPTKDIIYCARPRQKIWSATTDGNVQFSYIHKKSPEHSVIKLLNEKSNHFIPKPEELLKASFGLLHHIRDSILVSHSENFLIILDVSVQRVLGYSECFHKICDVAVSDNYIFILDDCKNIICLSQCKPNFCENLLIHMSKSLQENLNLTTLSEMMSKVKLPKKQFIDGLTKFGETMASKVSEVANPTIISGSKKWPGTQSFNTTSSVNSAPQASALSSKTNYQENVKLSSILEDRPIPVSPYESRDPHSTGTVFEEKVDSSQIVANEEDIEKSSLLVMHNLPQKMYTKKDVCTYAEPHEEGNDTCAESENSLDFNIDAIVEDDSNDAVCTLVNGNLSDESRSYDLQRKIEEKEKLLANVLDLKCLKMYHKEEKKNEEKEIFLFSSHDPAICSTACDENCPTRVSDKNFCGEEYNDNNRMNSNPSLYHRMSSNDSQNYSSYGPPSGSSIPTSMDGVVSCKDTNFNPTLPQSFEYNFSSETLASDWFKHYLPGQAHTLGSSGAILCFIDNYYIYFTASSVDVSSHGWKKRKLPIDAQKLYHSSKEHEMLLHTGDGLFIVDNLFSMDPLKFTFLVDDVQFAASDCSVLWILNSNNSLTAKVSSLDGGMSRDFEVSCLEFSLINIISNSGVVWALLNNGTIAIRIGVSDNSPTGVSWDFIPPHQFPIKCIHLSAHGLGWCIDSEGNIFFKTGIEKTLPYGIDEQWWQIEQGEFMMVSNEFLMTSTEFHLWICDKGSNSIFVHSLAALSGHRWNRAIEGKWLSVSAEGMYKTYGALLCTNSEGKLFALSSNSSIRELLPVDLPRKEKLFCVSSRPEAIWLLTEDGNLYIRAGVSINSVIGKDWVKLDLHEIADIRLVHLSLGVDVVWAVDDMGKVYMRQGPLNPPSKKGLAPGWLHVESTELRNEEVFSKVFVGNKLDLVWGIDTSYRIYVREAIFQELSTGTSWVLVSGQLAKHIAIGEDRVFILTPFNKIFERVGVSSTNYIGNSWKKIPSPPISLVMLTVTVDNCLWGLSTEGVVWKQTCQKFLNGKPVPAEEDVVGEHYEWEIIENNDSYEED